jgi:hypothetical protein
MKLRLEMWFDYETEPPNVEFIWNDILVRGHNFNTVLQNSTIFRSALFTYLAT